MKTTAQIALLTTTQQKPTIDSKILTWQWGIPLNKAKRKVQRTTQHGMRNIANLTLAQRFCTNVCMLGYRFLHHTVFTDTMIASTLSRDSNKCAEIFTPTLDGHVLTL